MKITVKRYEIWPGRVACIPQRPERSRRRQQAIQGSTPGVQLRIEIRIGVAVEESIDAPIRSQILTGRRRQEAFNATSEKLIDVKVPVRVLPV